VRLRARINQLIVSGIALIYADGIRCHQIFDLNYGVVRYVDRERHQANAGRLPNPIEYIYLKAHRFSAEKELRVSLSALGLGQFVLADGSLMEFPRSLQLQFDYRAAIADGTIRELLLGPETDAAYLQVELDKLRIARAPEVPSAA